MSVIITFSYVHIMYLDYICPFLPQQTGTLLKVREFIYDYARTIGTMTVVP
jgi:hypothetical protein